MASNESSLLSGTRSDRTNDEFSDDDDATSEVWEDALEELDQDDKLKDEEVPFPVPERSREEELRESLDEANVLKGRGNDLFRASKWEEAMKAYQEGISFLPVTVVPSPSPSESKGNESAEVIEAPDQLEPPPAKLLENQWLSIRSILHANIGACYVKMGDHKSAVESCTSSLRDIPTYTKALHRRATSNEALGTFTSLSSAEKDYQALLATLPPTSPLLPSIRKSVSSLAPRIAAAQKAEMDEMLGKLKGLGNSILGRFGLSTDNFAFTPNGEGGYSMNFQQE